MTHEEIKQQHLTVMGPELGPLYHALHKDLLWLHEKWLEYRKLYGTKERVDLLNQTAGFFFRVVQDVLSDDVLLHIARLTDDPGTADKTRLVLSRLKGLIRDPTLARELRELLKIARSQAEFVRELRNRRLAHTDLELAVNDQAQQLDEPSRKNIDDVLSSFRAVLNAVHQHYLGVECSFDDIHVVADAETLLHHLKFGLQSEQQRMDRHMSGRAIPEDHEPFPSV